MRNLSIDVARGLGILLVVFGHAWRGGFDAGLGISQDTFRLIDHGIYAFHMPLFFFLAALLFVRTTRGPLSTIVGGRVTRLLWPMALWTWVFFAAKIAAGSLQNDPVGWAEFPLIPLPPYAHLWFLWALFLIQVPAILLLKAMPQSWHDGTGFRLSMAAAGLALGLAMPLIHLPSLIFGAAVYHLPFFLLGLACAGLVQMRPQLWTAAGAGAVVIVFIWIAAVPNPPIPLIMAILLLLWVAVAGFCANVASRPRPQLAGRIIAGLGLLGVMSLPIYLTHTIFSAGLREVLIAAHAGAVPVRLLAITAAGLIGPLLVYRIARRAGLLRVLGF